MVAESVELELLKTAEESEKHGILSSTPNASKTSSNPPLIAILPEITLPDFLRKYNVSTFKKDTFREVRLVGNTPNIALGSTGQCILWSGALWRTA